MYFVFFMCTDVVWLVKYFEWLLSLTSMWLHVHNL